MLLHSRSHHQPPLLLTLFLLCCMTLTCNAKPISHSTPPFSTIPNLKQFEHSDSFSQWKQHPPRHSHPSSHHPSSSNTMSDWQGNMLSDIGDLTLKQMILPGTHDSGAYSLTDQLAPDSAGSPLNDAIIEVAEELGIAVQDIITPLSLSQTMDLYQQALEGIRYFDLRICYNGSIFTTYHFEIGNPIVVLLEDLARFLSEHEQEVIIVEGQLWQPVNDTIPFEEKVDFIQSVFDIFSSIVTFYPESDTLDLTYSELISSELSYRLLFTINDPEMYAIAQAISDNHDLPASFLWPDMNSSVIWNTYADTPNLTEMIQFNTQQIIAFNNDSSVDNSSLLCDRDDPTSICLYKISWTLTPDANTIFGLFDPSQPHSLIELADTANQVLAQFANSTFPPTDASYSFPSPSSSFTSPSSYQFGNIFIIDDFTNSPIMAIVLQQNRLAGSKKRKRG